MHCQVRTRRFFAAIFLMLTLSIPTVSRSSAASLIDPHVLALDVTAYPAGALITHVHVDTTASEVNAEQVIGDNYKNGDVYSQLHFSGSLLESAHLPSYNGAQRWLLLLATVFPSAFAATKALASDAQLGSCDASPPVAMPMRAITCAYSNLNGPESGMYVLAAEDTVEFVVVGFIRDASNGARDQAIRDASGLARHEATHVIHILRAQPQHLATGATSTSTPTPRPTATPHPTAPAVSHKPVSSNKRCPAILHNRGWGKVNLRPDLYVGCVVDIAAQVYSTQTLDGYVSYNSNLNPDVGPDWYVFAYDYSDNPPSIPDNTWTRIQGKIEASVESDNSLTGAFQGYVPEVKVVRITTISELLAKRMGADASS